MEETLFGVSIEIWYCFAGAYTGFQYKGVLVRVESRRRALVGKTKRLRLISSVRPIPPAAICAEESGVQWASSGCDLTDQILAAARSEGINPGEFLDGVG